jgi:hypothetical protein
METWGMKLGSVVNTIRGGKSHVDKRKDLESIGFNYESQSRSHGYELVKVALQTFKDLNGDMLVPKKFVVPINDITWPEETWGMKLGNVVNNIRGGNSHVKKREDLESIGFNFNPQKLIYGYEAIKVALMKYKELEGDMLVPQKFVVPEDDITWPEETWGMKLGIVVRNIRRGNSHVKKRIDLENIGFNYDSQSRYHGYELVKVALQTYKDLNGDMLVPNKFVVPEDDITWTEETWGMKLGSVVHDIRRGKSHVDKRKDLESIGFNFNPQKLLYGYEATKVASMKYKELKGDMLVSQRFVVPEDDITWPIETWGMKLGIVVRNIRGGNSYVKKRIDLENMGFDYSPQKGVPKRKGVP